MRRMLKSIPSQFVRVFVSYKNTKDSFGYFVIKSVYRRLITYRKFWNCNLQKCAFEHVYKILDEILSVINQHYYWIDYK